MPASFEEILQALRTGPPEPVVEPGQTEAQASQAALQQRLDRRRRVKRQSLLTSIGLDDDSSLMAPSATPSAIAMKSSLGA